MDNVFWYGTLHLEHVSGVFAPSALHGFATLQVDYFPCVELLHAAGEYMNKRLKIHFSLIQKHVSQCQSLDELLLNSCESDHVMRL